MNKTDLLLIAVLLIAVLLLSFSCSRAPKPKTDGQDVVEYLTEPEQKNGAFKKILNGVVGLTVVGAFLAVSHYPAASVITIVSGVGISIVIN